ncbi:AfsR/SARP family transcriptional regulator [Streptomyces sp. NPDC086091]|uniref:AfsR/SARP family transcriptional regulator n=1 Tax=Streptomyces sp. NPDC086091 TaxID=3365751 RepID=UPI00381FCC0E
MRFRLLGRLDVTASDGTPIDLSGLLARSIVARLVLAGGRPVQRDTLIDELWGDREARNPVNALQVQMTKLRAVLAEHGEDGRLGMRAGGYRFLLDDRDHVDVTDFENAVRRGREQVAAGAYREAEETLRGGLGLWHGRALEDLPGPAFDGERRRLEELRLAATEDAVGAGLERGRAEELVPELTGLLAENPFRDRLRARLMLALYRCGRHAEALEVFHSGRRLLDTELGLAPSPELQALQTAILTHDPSLHGPSVPVPADLTGPSPATASDVAAPEAAANPGAHLGSAPGAATRPDRPGDPAPRPPVPPERPEGNLGRSLGPFVGRDRTLRDLRAAIARERLVTVLGPGGVGKTRLTLEALSQIGSPVDAIWWVDLAAIGEDDVLAAVATTLGLSDASVATGQGPLDFLRRVVSSLHDRTAIIALDNCEHVLDTVAPLVKDLLDRCPSLTVVATSREPLSTPREAHFTLEPMTAEEAAELFALRASMINPAFEADTLPHDELLALVRRLDGLPLAVELAAAHVRMLSVAEINRRLDDRFALLVKGERTAPARHRTLRAVLDWSHALLDDSEQAVLSELALRVGGTSLEDAERADALMSEDGIGTDTGAGVGLLPILTQLVDKSMLFIVRSPTGTRFQMLEMVREYAMGQIRAKGLLPVIERRFTAWALAFTAEHTAALHSREQATHCLRLAEEAANLRAASELLVRRGRSADALVLESSLGYFWYVSGREEEGVDRLSRTLDAYDREKPDRAAHRDLADDTPTGPTDPAEEWALVYTFAWLSWLSHVAGRHDTALAYEDRYRATWRRAANPDLAAVGPVYDALFARLTADADRGDLFAEAEAAVAPTRFQWDHAVLQYNWSTYCLHSGDPDAARERARRGIEAARAADDPFALAICLTARGDAEESTGARETARALWSEAADILWTADARSRWAYRTLRLAFLDVGEGDLDRAERRLDEVKGIAADVVSSDLAGAAAVLRGVLLLARSRTEAAEAAFREVAGSPAAPHLRRSVAALALAACGSDGDGLAEVRRSTGPIIEPRARVAVTLLLDEAEEHRRAEPGRPYPLHERLAVSPSVLAAFC